MITQDTTHTKLAERVTVVWESRVNGRFIWKSSKWRFWHVLRNFYGNPLSRCDVSVLAIFLIFDILRRFFANRPKIHFLTVKWSRMVWYSKCQNLGKRNFRIKIMFISYFHLEFSIRFEILLNDRKRVFLWTSNWRTSTMEKTFLISWKASEFPR